MTGQAKQLCMLLAQASEIVFSRQLSQCSQQHALSQLCHRHVQTEAKLLPTQQLSAKCITRQL